MNIKVSVVVPVCNVEKYLPKCLDSIINQTLKEIEIICVNDGSTDSSGKILDEYAIKDNRIKVIHKENAGYGHTMNVGFDLVQGEYIGIVESDDYIEENMYEFLYEKSVENNLDFIKSKLFNLFDCEDGTTRKRKHDFLGLSIEDGIISSKNMDPEIFTIHETYRKIWACLYNTNFIRSNNIRFNETPGASYQDVGFNIEILLAGERVLFVDEYFYNYRMTNPFSSVKSKDKLKCIFEEYDFSREYIKNNNIQKENIKNIIDYCSVVGLMYQFNRISSDNIENLTYLIKDYILKNDIVASTTDVSTLVNDTEYFINNKVIEKDHIEKVNEKLKNTINTYNKVIIYGAGVHGIYIYDKLGFIQSLNKVHCYAVTKKPEHISSFHDMDLKEIKDLVHLKDEALVIIAGIRSNVFTMNKNLKDLGFKNIVTSLEFM